MLRKTFLGTILAFLASVLLFFAVWQYQRRTLTWSPVQIEITSSKIAHFRESRTGRVWTATVDYSFDGKNYTKTIHDLPFGATQVYVDPDDPSNVVGERGATVRALFVPIIAISATGLFGFVLILIKLSPSDDKLVD